MNVIAQLKYELAYYDSAVHRFNHFTTRTPLPKSDRSLLSCLKVTHCSTSEIGDAPLYNSCSLPIPVMTTVLYIDLWPRPNMPFQRRGSCIFHWRGRAWDRVKIPRYCHRLMLRKRVTCELHDSYGEILSGRVNYYITRWRQEVSSFGDQTSWRKDAVEKTSNQQRSGPPGLRLSNPGERKRNAAMANRMRVNMLQFCSVSNSLSHTNPFNKVRGIFF